VDLILEGLIFLVFGQKGRPIKWFSFVFSDIKFRQKTNNTPICKN